MDSTTSLPGEFEELPPQEESPADDEELTYAQLREIYDNEEIQRFIDIFAAHVTEVRAPNVKPYNVDQDATGSSHTVQETVVEDDHVDGDSWISLYDAPKDQGLAAEIAQRYLIPYLPPPTPPPPVFTFGRLRLALERLYLFFAPIYIPWLIRLLRLAIWEDTYRSGIYCSIFWFLWFFDLLLPAALLRVFYALVRRRIFPYPTLEELRERRNEVERAAHFGGVLSSRLSASSSLGVKEMWRLYRVVNKGKRTRLRNVFTKSQGNLAGDGEDEATVLDDETETQEERDLKRLGLQLVNGIADLNERIKNLFMWRKPMASRVFGLAIFICFIGTLILPARLVAKLIYLSLGFVFWHVTPVVASMSAKDRARLPAPLAGVPTDAEYALEVISKRIAAGQDITHKKKTRSRRNTDASMASPTEFKDSDKKGTDWQKWNDRAIIGKTWAGEGKRLIRKGVGKPETPSISPIIPGPVLAIGQSPTSQTNYTFFCQRSGTPGYITLTQTIFTFTPFMSNNPSISLPLSRLQGVRKTSWTKGLSLTWSSEDGHGQDEDTYRMIENREELFARLVGLEGKGWLKA